MISTTIQTAGAMVRTSRGIQEKPMNCRLQLLRSFLIEDSGQDLIEYALIAALIAVAAISAVRGLGNKISNEFNTIGSSL